MFHMDVTNFKLWPTVLDPDRFEPKRKMVIDLMIRWEAQYDGRALTPEEEKQRFVEENIPLLVEIYNKILSGS